MTFDDLFDASRWKPIRGCPGRFVLRDQAPTPIEALVGGSAPITRLVSDKARDEVLVVAFADGSGLISYARPDGSVVHTLNTASGFERKLAQLALAPR